MRHRGRGEEKTIKRGRGIKFLFQKVFSSPLPLCLCGAILFFGGSPLPPNHRKHVGRWGENTAAAYLEQRGYRILARNVHNRYGEIDLIASAADGSLVFVEVKTRTGQTFGDPEEAVDRRKVEHLSASAEAYMVEHPELTGQNWQIDVIAILGRPGEKLEDVQIEYFENIAS
jgi:putative endonuclease